MRYSNFQNYIFSFFALLLFGAALHHLYEYFVPELRPEYSGLRHMVFFVINLALAFVMLKRSKNYLPVLLLIGVQQLYGHGGNLLETWSNDSGVLYTDLAVVILAPIVFFLYTYDVFRDDVNKKSGINL